MEVAGLGIIAMKVISRHASGCWARSGHGSRSGMTMSSNPYRGFHFPAEVIQHAVWLYHCFSFSLRDVETIFAARGVVVSYESIREWKASESMGWPG